MLSAGVLFVPLLYVLTRGVVLGITPGRKGVQLYSVDGKVDMLTAKDSSWLSLTRILVDGGKYQAFLRTDGRFTVNGLPPGSYVVEVTHPSYMFPSLRVDITYEGRRLARKVDHVQSTVSPIQYPLVFREARKARFFEKRYSWNVAEILYNPMVLSLVMPLALVLIYPKLVGQSSMFDPKAQAQFRRQLNSMTGGRGGMIGMGVSPDESGGGTRDSRGSNKAKDGGPGWSFDLAEIFTNIFYTGDTASSADTGRTKSKRGRKRILRN